MFGFIFLSLCEFLFMDELYAYQYRNNRAYETTISGNGSIAIGC